MDTYFSNYFIVTTSFSFPYLYSITLNSFQFVAKKTLLKIRI